MANSPLHHGESSVWHILPHPIHKNQTLHLAVITLTVKTVTSPLNKGELTDDSEKCDSLVYVCMRACARKDEGKYSGSITFRVGNQ